MTGSDSNSPREDTLRAWEVAFNPREANDIDLSDLIQRGYNSYLEGGELNEDRMLDEIENFVLKAVDRPSFQEVSNDPTIRPDEPGKLVVLATFGSTLLLQNEELKSHHREIIYHERVEELFCTELKVALREYGGENPELLMMAAETVYTRDHPDDYGTPPGRVVTDITPMPHFGEGMYIEIPLVHAGMNTNIRDSNHNPICGLDNNAVYVPESDLTEKVTDHVLGRYGTASYLGQRHYQGMNDGQINYMVANATKVKGHITKELERGNYDKLFEEQTHPPKLKVILAAIEAADDQVAQLRQWHSAKQLFEAIEDYANNDSKRWEKTIINQVGSSRGLGNYLSNNIEHKDVEMYQHRSDEDHPAPDRFTNDRNLYRLRFNETSAETIQVTNIEDILELPCMQNMHDFLLERKPVRFVLYSFVRIILSVDNDFTVEEIVDWFRQYPWFDEETTRYQVRYEKNRRNENNDPYLPLNCYTDREEFKQFCIGIDSCEYEIHGSLPMKEEVLNAKSKE